MNGKRVFIDTNIFVYAKLENPQDAEKHRDAVSFLANIEQEVIISIQVINEFSNVLLRHGIEDKIIRQSVKEMADACRISPLTLKTVEEAWRIRGNYHFSYWDSLIIGSAIENRCTVLYTEDLQHTQIIENCLQIINPFLKA
ncbi:PIN domain-containing protein [Desulfococcaceae bacterium HSG7]|nr:PIN domain-containing protein [Desulfococcaceae bacterium HSG7]